MPQDENAAIDLRQAQQSPPHQLAFLLARQLRVGRRRLGRELAPRRNAFALVGVERRFPSAIDSAQFVIAKVQRDAPKPGGKSRVRLKALSFFKHPREGFLLQVLGAMRVAGHARAEPANRFLPALHQLREGVMILLRLDPPHCLLVGHRDGHAADPAAGSGSC